MEQPSASAEEEKPAVNPEPGAEAGTDAGSDVEVEENSIIIYVMDDSDDEDADQDRKHAGGGDFDKPVIKREPEDPDEFQLLVAGDVDFPMDPAGFGLGDDLYGKMQEWRDTSPETKRNVRKALSEYYGGGVGMGGGAAGDWFKRERRSASPEDRLHIAEAGFARYAGFALGSPGTTPRNRPLSKRVLNETPEQRARRLAKMAEYTARKLANETAEERAARLAKMAEYTARRLALETPEQRQMRLKKMADYTSRRKALRKKLEAEGVIVVNEHLRKRRKFPDVESQRQQIRAEFNHLQL